MMTLTREQEIRLRLLSDDEFYHEAVKFIKEHGTIKNTQIAGLENIAATVNEFEKIVQFSRHQAQKKKNEKGRDENAEFFQALTSHFNAMKQRIKSDHEYVPQGLPRKKQREHIEFYGLLFAREFIHHLSAEHRYQEKE